MNTPEDELTTLSQLRSGNRSRWDEVYRLLWDTGMKVVCPGLSGERYGHDREDIVQQAIMELHRDFFSENSHNQFRSMGDLKGMMFTITRRRLLDFHRKKFRRGEESHADPALAGGAMESSAVDGDMDSEGVWGLVPEGLDDPAKLWELVGRLKPPKPELLEDRFIHQLSAAEVEAKRGIARNTVLSHWHLSMKTLRRWISGSND
jgi:DNA-directed RNA polymerase specialized sigma24 family protein